MSEYCTRAHLIMQEVGKVIAGKDECIRKVMAAILAGGHVLLEDVPGVGKTEMALAFSKAMGLSSNRIQFTPDVMPADITGFSIYRRDLEKFEFHEGAAMCNLLLADEINRTSPKTQSALLEVMEEGNITVDGVTRKVPSPFIVLATQNPIGSYGTSQLPEAQVDRFLICITMGYPDMGQEIRMLKSRHNRRPLDEVTPIVNGEELSAMQRETAEVFIHDRIYEYMVLLADATRKHPLLELGLSPRGTLALGKMARAYAWLEERDYVVPKDVTSAIYDVAAHRMRLNAKAKADKKSMGDVITEVLGKVRTPVPGDK